MTMYFMPFDIICLEQNSFWCMSVVLAAMESSIITYSLVKLPWNIGLNSLMSSGLSWAWAHHFLMKSSILIGLFCAVVVLNASPSIGSAAGGSIRLIYSALISCSRKVMLKIPQARLQQYMNRELPDVQEKAEEPEIKLPTSAGSSKKQESSRKTSISALLTMPKPLTVWITINCGKFWERWEYKTAWPASWETCMQVRKQQLELDMEQQTSSKQEKEYTKAVYCHPAYLTYMQSI